MDQPSTTDRPKERRRWVGPTIAGLLACTALSSYATQRVASNLEYHSWLGTPIAYGLYEPFGWMVWQAKPWAANVKPAFLGVNLTVEFGTIGIGFVVLAVLGRTRKKPVKHEGVHGTARFKTPDEVLSSNLVGNDGGVYIGSYEHEGVVHYLRHDGAEHIAAIAPTRSGKGVGLVVPTLLSWPHSAFVNDEKGELWELTAGWRKSIGQRVLLWAPGDAHFSCRFNFLAEIRLGTEYEVEDAENIAIMIVDPNGAGLKDHWAETAYALLSGLILHVLYEKEDASQTASMADVGDALRNPLRHADDLYADMVGNAHLGGSPHPFVAMAGADQLNREAKERTAVHSSAVTAMGIFSGPIVRRNTSQSDFHITDLMDHRDPVTLYVHIPASDKDRLRPLMRLMTSVIIRRLTGVPIAFGPDRQPVIPHRHKLLMMMDEFPGLGKLSVFENTLATCAGFGIKAYLIMQDREQLLRAYGQNETVLSNCHLRIVYAPNKYETAKWISDVLDNYTLNLGTISRSGKGVLSDAQITQAMTITSRKLMTPGEVGQMPGPRKEGDRIVSAGRLLIIPSGEPPIYGRQILYFEDPVFVARAAILPPGSPGTLHQQGFGLHVGSAVQSVP